MSGIVPPLGAPSTYRDRKYEGGLIKLEEDLEKSTTLYIGNLSFFTTEEQIYELFSKCGEIKRIIMGLDRIKKTPCGFSFVEYHHRQDALDCMSFINGTKLDERLIRIDIDPGFVNGRQYGRGRSGGQVRDDHREDYDEGRGGWGARMREDEQREQHQRDVYDGQNSFAHVSQGASDYYTKSYIQVDNIKPKRERDDSDNEGDTDEINGSRRSQPMPKMDGW
ncbi:nuclear cap binding complex subunit [Batrachochytrium dendrobatidis]|uniref:Nuclear cap-binding protein subunit 2 n=1 Tax=Batrachochytrium dendrobatidis (strain JEL423) TaxID=403673 RepID=A0A177WHP3_BATDL|nr:nuclear cap binding complex subunit [Batrachochytrium dendrobatidis]KAK5672648.1 nuclear cap binding complex subunit [Batrachochytrium dendrobatidis]OAJ39204.1 hypothetical protein BDEG_23068 [Batrachochytrium dendrobatidis JEL423]